MSHEQGAAVQWVPNLRGVFQSGTSGGWRRAAPQLGMQFRDAPTGTLLENSWYQRMHEAGERSHKQDDRYSKSGPLVREIGFADRLRMRGEQVLQNDCCSPAGCAKLSDYCREIFPN